MHLIWWQITIYHIKRSSTLLKLTLNDDNKGYKLWECNNIIHCFIIPWRRGISHQNIPIMPLWMWTNGNKNNCSPFPVLVSAAVTVATFQPRPDPHDTSSIPAVIM